MHFRALRESRKRSSFVINPYLNGRALTAVERNA